MNLTQRQIYVDYHVYAKLTTINNEIIEFDGVISNIQYTFGWNQFHTIQKTIVETYSKELKITKVMIMSITELYREER